MAVAVFKLENIVGDVEIVPERKGVKLIAHFTKLPKGKHGFHIHKAGDLRGDGCHGLCEHYDVGKNSHGAGPDSQSERHTGDLGNIEIPFGKKEVKKVYFLKDISVKDLWGRSIIVHEDEDDLGKGEFEDSKITGHSGARIGCAIFGRILCEDKMSKTKRNTKKLKIKTKKAKKPEKISKVNNLLNDDFNPSHWI
jgi:Cu-Zn family superoxide dismutase